MQQNTAWQRNLKAAAGICMLAAMLFLLTGCGKGSAFEGSSVSNASGFWVEYSVLNQEESADLNLKKGERLQVDLSHADGYVDVTVGIEGQEPIYRGNGQQNAAFLLEIAETGKYHIAVSGYHAKGSVSFTRISEDQD